MKANLFLLAFLASALACAAETTTGDATETPETTVDPNAITVPITESLTISDGATHTLTNDDASVDAINLKSGAVLVSGSGTALEVTTSGSTLIGSGVAAGEPSTVTLTAADGGTIRLIGPKTNHAHEAYDTAERVMLGANSSEEGTATVELISTGQGSTFLIDHRDWSGAGESGDNWGGISLGAKRQGVKDIVKLTASNGGTMILQNVDDYTTATHYGAFLDSFADTTLTASEGGKLVIAGKYIAYAHSQIDLKSGGQMEFGRSYNSHASLGDTDISVDGAGSKLTFRKSMFLPSSKTTDISITNGGQMEVWAMMRSDNSSGTSPLVDVTISGQGSRLDVLCSQELASSYDGDYYLYGINAYYGRMQFAISDGGVLQTATSYNNGSIKLEATGVGSEANNTSLYYQYDASSTGSFGAKDGALVSFKQMDLTGGKTTFEASGADGNAGRLEITGRYYNSAGSAAFKVTQGGQLSMTGSVYAGSQNEITVDGEGSKASFAEYRTYTWEDTPQGTSTIALTNGATMEVSASFDNYAGSTSTFTISGGGQFLGMELYENGTLAPVYTNRGESIFNMDGSGAAEGSTGMAFYFYLNRDGATTFDLKNGAAASIVSYSNDAGATTTINIGEMASEAAPAAYGVMTLAEGEGTEGGVALPAETFRVGSYTNKGTTTINISAGDTFNATEYINEGDSTINAEAGATVHFDDLQLVSGSMALEGEGTYEGLAGSETTFYVTGSTLGDASSTLLDVSSLTSEQFSLAADATFTLSFSSDLVAELQAEGEKGPVSLTLITGYEGFELSEEALALLAETTTYVSTDVPDVLLTLAGTATYSMQGNNLVWTFGEETAAVPEPATATLSLLALAALATRRRRR